MPDTPELSATKRALLEKYLRGELAQTKLSTSITAPLAQKDAVSLPKQDSPASVVALQSGGSKRPLFYLHVHWEGGAFYCFTLAHDLGSDQPFYVLEPYKFDSLQDLPTLEAMATAYIESIRAIQPEGPYLLGGFCGGGLVAYEIAQQLLAQGQSVDLLVLIEPKAGPAPLELIGARLVGNCIRRIGKLVGLSQDKQLDWFLNVRHFNQLLKYPEYRKSPNVSIAPNAEVLRQDWLAIFTWVISDYSPRYYPGKVTYLWANEEPGNHRALWGKVARAKEIEMQFIPGTAGSCRNEYIHDMAHYLRVCLNAVQDAS